VRCKLYGAVPPNKSDLETIECGVPLVFISPSRLFSIAKLYADRACQIALASPSQHGNTKDFNIHSSDLERGARGDALRIAVDQSKPRAYQLSTIVGLLRKRLFC
jgi:hypothetical protein